MMFIGAHLFFFFFRSKGEIMDKVDYIGPERTKDPWF